MNGDFLVNLSLDVRLFRMVLYYYYNLFIPEHYAVRQTDYATMKVDNVKENYDFIKKLRSVVIGFIE